MAYRQAESLSLQPAIAHVPRTVIVALESDVSRARMTSELRSVGYQVLEMQNGVELMEYLEEALRPLVPFPVPDAIIASADLQGYTGLEVCWALRKFDSAIPFLLVLRSRGEVDWQELAEAGPSFVGTEPLDAHVVKDVLGQLCADQRA